MNGVAAGFGPAIMTWADVQAWADLTGEAPEPWETRALIRLSATRAEVLARKAERTHGAADTG